MRSIFAIEVAARLDLAPGLLPTLRSAIGDAPGKVGPQRKWEQCRIACDALVNHVGLIERGCWDYFDDDARANATFRDWLGAMTTGKGARQAPSGRSEPYRGEPRYLTFTMTYLLVRPSPTDEAVRRLCNVPESRLWRRDTFARLLGGMGVISFASVESDVTYMLPRDDDWGLTAGDLADPTFAYLRPLEG